MWRILYHFAGESLQLTFNREVKSVKVVGKVKFGLVVNGVGYGILSIKGMGAVPFTCTCE